MLKIGVAGLRRGASLFEMFVHHPEVRVTAVCDADGERAAAFARDHQVPVKLTVGVTGDPPRRSRPSRR
jgi:predicted dehydrogenase